MDLTKSIASNFILFNRAKKLKILKPDLDNIVSVFKASKKVFKSIFVLNKYKKTFEFKLKYFNLQINIIKFCQLTMLYLSSIYAKIDQKILNNKLWKIINRAFKQFIKLIQPFFSI